MANPISARYDFGALVTVAQLLKSGLSLDYERASGQFVVTNDSDDVLKRFCPEKYLEWYPIPVSYDLKGRPRFILKRKEIPQSESERIKTALKVRHFIQVLLEQAKESDETVIARLKEMHF